MTDDPGWAVPTPAFKPDEALVQLRRSLRDCQLAERGLAYELRGKRIVELAAEADAIAVKLARKPALTPEWDRLRIRSGAEQRKFVDDLKKRLARWERED